MADQVNKAGCKVMVASGRSYDVMSAPRPEHGVALGGDGRSRLLCGHRSEVLGAL